MHKPSTRPLLGPKTRMALKLAVGVGLVTYVLKSKMVDFETLHSVVWRPTNMAFGLAFLAFSLLCSAARWHLLVRAQGLSLSYVHLVELTMIGNFFNTFMPGSVGGDLMKAWYVAGREPTRKTRAIFTVLLDRAIGLAVIVCYSAVTLLFYTEWLVGRPQMKLVALTIWAFTGACFLGNALFFWSGLWRMQWPHRLIALLRRNARVATLVDATLLYRSHFRSILLAVLLSAISVLGLNLLFKFQGDALGISMTLPQYFFVVPLALTASAVPLLPGGIGVGQVAFFTLFQWIGVAEPQQGATVCTLIQIYTLMFNCIGGIFYVRFKRGPAHTHPGDSVGERERKLGHARHTSTSPAL